MSDKMRVFAYHSDDNKVLVYNMPEEQLQISAEIFHREIFFLLTDKEVGEIYNDVVDNLKEDFIWFQPGLNKLHIIQCTCGHFLESGSSMDKLAKLGLKHHKRTGHTINLRGN